VLPGFNEEDHANHSEIASREQTGEAETRQTAVSEQVRAASDPRVVEGQREERQVYLLVQSPTHRSTDPSAEEEILSEEQKSAPCLSAYPTAHREHASAVSGSVK